MSVILVKFDSNPNNTYAYFCDYNVQIGDRVIVESPYNGYTAVTVVSTAGHDAIKATKEVVCTIDDRRYKERLACKARLAEITAELDRRERERVNVSKYAELAKSDPMAARLMEEADWANKFLLESTNPNYDLDLGFDASKVQVLSVNSPEELMDAIRKLAGVESPEADAPADGEKKH